MNGDSLDVSKFRDYDSEANATLINDLQNKSGLTLVTDENGNVTYTKKDGKAVVSRDENGKRTGSKAAQKALIKLIDSKHKVSVDGTDGLTRTDMDGPNPNLILINPQQMQNQIDKTSKDLNQTTFGYALTFFHEVAHTAYGGAGIDPPSSGENPFEQAGRQEILPNLIRRQLGAEYGQRVTYGSYYDKNTKKNFFPWSPKTLRQLKLGNTPVEKNVEH